jgi:ubiquinone/menaquinone biosynthesis C-methylase UbiE
MSRLIAQARHMQHTARRRSSARFSAGKEERQQDMRISPHQQAFTRTPTVCASDELDEREVRRQLFLFHQLNQALGGPVPAPLVDLTRVSSVLDVFCGVGGWTLDLACDYPHMRVTGIDTSERALASARRLVREGGFTNVCFSRQDLCCSPASLGDLPNAPFDLIHTAFLAPYLLRMDYLALLQTLWGLCRPGGLVCWTEMEFPLTNSPALERLMSLTCEALTSAGQSCPSYSTSAQLSSARHTRGVATLLHKWGYLGMIPLLGTWFQQAGYQQVQQIATPIEVSSGTEANPCFTRQVEAFLRHIRPWLLAWEVITPEAVAQLACQVEAEVQQESFCGLCWLLSVLGQKPAGEHSTLL